MLNELTNDEAAIWLLDSDDLAIDEIRTMPLADFCEKYLVIQDKQDRIIPLKLNRAQRHFAENITTRNVILKARQLGFSTVIQAYIFKRVLSEPSRFVTMAHDDKTTSKLRRMSKLFFDKLPASINIKRNLDNAAITSYSNHSEITISSAGSKEGGRGGTYGGGFHWSEVAFTTNAQEIVSGVMQGVPDSGVIFLESSANGSSGYFYDSVMKAKNGDSEYKLHFYAWWWNEEYQTALLPGEVITYTDEEKKLVDKHGLTPEQIKWRRNKQSTPGLVFQQEYPEDEYTAFKNSGDGYFGNVDHALNAPLKPEYNAAHRYVAGLDFGQQKDYTVLIIIDATVNQMVYMVRVRHELWAEMRRAVREACKKWNVQVMHAEKNSMGSSEIESLYTEFAAAGLKTDIIPFNMTAVNKPSLMAHYRTALHEGGLLLQDLPVIRHELDSAVSKQTQRGWTVESPRDGDSGHGDTVVAGALANYSIGFI